MKTIMLFVIGIVGVIGGFYRCYTYEPATRGVHEGVVGLGLDPMILIIGVLLLAWALARASGPAHN